MESIDLQPIQQDMKFSPAFYEYWTGNYSDSSKETRLAAILRITFTTDRPGYADTIGSSYTGNDKLHDGEPAIIMKKLLQLSSSFFEGMPHKGKLTTKKVLDNIGDALRITVKSGKSLYVKPNLRKTKVEPKALQLVNFGDIFIDD